MNSFIKSLLFAGIKLAAWFFMLLPMRISLWMGRCMGAVAYFFMSRKRKVVYANLKTVFAAECPPAELERMTRLVFINFIQSVVELLCLPKIKRLGFDEFVELHGKENLNKAHEGGKGVIFLAIHSGSWELASIIGGVTKGAYHVVVNVQSRISQLDKMLNEYRTMAGANVITAGSATKEILQALHADEIVSLVLDQGGKTGVVVPFLGKSSSMATGAMRLGLKYGCAVCPVWIERQKNGKHVLNIFEPLALTVTGDTEKDIRANVIRAAARFEALLKQHPTEYHWFYKVFKYAYHRRILIINDGRTGHLRQSQAVARHLAEVLKKRDRTVEINTVNVQWRSPWLMRVFSVYVFLAQYSGFLKKEKRLRCFLTDASFKDVMKYKADYVVSCGSQAAGINFILSRSHLARSISILTPGLLFKERFDVMVSPEHDRPKPVSGTHLITPKVSPNLINPAYLKEQGEGLVRHYSHLKGNARTKFGILIGGNTPEVKFDEATISQLISRLKEAALHYNADILLTTSRRTPAGIEQMIAKNFKNFERCPLCIIANQRNVPEAVGGILDLADLVIVSGESVSMVSEALSSGKPTIVFSPNGGYGPKPRDKYEGFVMNLNDQGYLMTSSMAELKAKIAQLLSHKVTFKALDDQSLIQKGLEAIA